MKPREGKFTLPEYGRVLTAAYAEASSTGSIRDLSDIAIAFESFCAKHFTADGFRFLPRFAATDEEILHAYNYGTKKNTVRVVKIPLHSLPLFVLTGFQTRAEDETIINPFGKLPWSDPRNKEAQLRRMIINQSGLGSHHAFEEILQESFSVPLKKSLDEVLKVEGLVNRIVTIISDLMYLAFAHGLEHRPDQAEHFIPLIKLCARGAIPIGDRQDGDKLFSCDVLFF